MSMHDLFLIKKLNIFADCWPNLVRRKKISDLSVEELVNKYNGFEGDLIFIKPVKDNYIEVKDTINQYLEINKTDRFLLLHIISAQELKPFNLQNRASFLGYEVGVYQGEQSFYSSIFNEILFGNVNELIVFKDSLNENLLFLSRDLAEKYVNVHKEMSAQGKDVEDYMEMIIYQIWKH